MALKNIIAPRQQVQNSQSKAVAGGNVYLYQPGTTSFITSYQDSGLVQPHSNPVRLSGSGRANIWITQDCDLRVEDRNGNLILEELNANPDAVGVDQGGGLVPNGSFEIDSDADTIPDGWTLASELGATNAIDTSQSTDGGQSFRFTSSGNGGGSLTSTDFFPVNDTDNLSVAVDMFASIATVLNIVRVEWYDISFVSISNSDIYSSTANPLTFTTQNLLATPPANARFAKLVLIGGDPSVAIAGSSWWDNVSVFYPAIVAGVFDNVTIQNNQIITTNVNGDLELGANGTGAVNISQANPVTLADAKNALNLGTDDPANDPHLALGLGAAGVTILQAKATGTTAVDTLDLQPLGGQLRMGQQTGTDGDTVDFYQNAFQVGQFDLNKLTIASQTAGDPTVPDFIPIQLVLTDQDFGEEYGRIGFDGVDAALSIKNFAEGGDIRLIGQATGGGENTILQADPDTFAALYHNGAQKIQTAVRGASLSGGVAAADPPTTEAVNTELVLLDLDSDTILGQLGFNTTNDLRINNVMREGAIFLTGTATAGTPRNLASFDPDADAILYHVGTSVARTITAATGGLEVNNQETGAGFERVLTASDLGINVEGVVDTAGQTITGSSLTDVSGMAITLSGSGAQDFYYFRAMVQWEYNNASYGDLQWDFTTAGTGFSIVGLLTYTLFDVIAGNLTDADQDTSFFGSGQMTPGGINDDHHWIAEGVLQYQGAIGESRVIQLRMARTGAAGNTIIRQFGNMHAYRIGN